MCAQSVQNTCTLYIVVLCTTVHVHKRGMGGRTVHIIPSTCSREQAENTQNMYYF